MRGRRLTLGALFLAGGIATQLSAQPAREPLVLRWNDRSAGNDTLPESPTVSLWLEGGRSFSYGAPVRVWFNVSDDAYVIVARVDANGHLSVLYPTNRARSTEVKGGEDIPIRGRRGAASFYATDRVGGGFVFAMASYDPFDLSRLSIRDFDRYVTGMYVGRPNRVYIGDPHRVVTRFAGMVLYADNTPFDYAVDYYSVDAPYYVTSAGFSNFCNGFAGQYRRGLAERWDDELYYGSALGSGYDCGMVSQCLAGLAAWGGFGWGAFDNPYCPNGRFQQQPIDPSQPPVNPPGRDSVRVPGWLPDSIRSGGGPDTVGIIPDRRSAELRDGLSDIRRGQTGTEAARRRIEVVADDPTDRSYAIPGRALRDSPVTIGQSRGRDGAIAERRDRITPSAGDASGINWVRPPREVVDGPRPPNADGSITRSPRERATRENGPGRIGRTTYVTGADSRNGVRERGARFDAPSRNSGPRFDSPRPSVRGNMDSPAYMPPPPRGNSGRFDGGGSSGPRYEGRNSGGAPSASPSGSSGATQRTEPVRAEPPRTAPASPPPPQRDPGSSGSGSSDRVSSDRGSSGDRRP